LVEVETSMSDCLFCPDKIKDRIVDELETVFAIEDSNPVTPGHLLIIPKRHVADYFDFTPSEQQDAWELIRILRSRMLENDRSVTGVNVGFNSGVSAGQTIFHAHIHLIPRRDGDTENPRGGVRGVIPGKRSY
jgi:ATP adenylyltransferase